MKRLLDFLDSLDFSPFTITTTIIILSIIRLFLENFSSPEPTGLFAPVTGVISYASLYGMLLVMFALAVSFLTKKSTLWSLRVMTLVFPIVILTPIIDLLFSGGVGHCIGYVQSGGRTLGYLFLNFLGPHSNLCGITPGLRIQIIIGSIGVATIIWTTTRSWLRSIGGALLAYIISFIGGTIPIIINILTRTDPSHTFTSDALASLLSTIHYPTSSIYFTIVESSITTILLARAQIIITLIGIAIIWFYGSRSTWKAWWLGSIKKIPIAAIHFVLLIFGLLLGFAVSEPTITWPDWLGIITLLVSLFLACWTVGVSNDVLDVPIDRISNPDRPLIKYDMSLENIRSIQYVAGIFSIACAAIVNYNAAFCIAVFMASYMIHSSGLRLKQFWVTSSFLIILSGIAAFSAGFFTLSSDQVAGNLPLSIIAMIAGLLVPYSIIKDIPDVLGDQSESIRTIPAIIGIRATIVLVIGMIIAWLVIFWNIIPWFFLLGVIIPIIVFTFKKHLIYRKIWLLGLPVGIWSVLIILHILFLT